MFNSVIVDVGVCNLDVIVGSDFFVDVDVFGNNEVIVFMVNVCCLDLSFLFVSGDIVIIVFVVYGLLVYDVVVLGDGNGCYGEVVNGFIEGVIYYVFLIFSDVMFIFLIFFGGDLIIVIGGIFLIGFF